MMSDTSVHKARSKHIDLRIWRLKDQVASGVVRLLSCPTAHESAACTRSSSPRRFTERSSAGTRRLRSKYLCAPNQGRLGCNINRVCLLACEIKGECEDGVLDGPASGGRRRDKKSFI